jgi:Magnesium chelatase, subunit ChlI
VTLPNTGAFTAVLFLDELTEFRRDAVEAFHQPLEVYGLGTLSADQMARLLHPAPLRWARADCADAFPGDTHEDHVSGPNTRHP